ncbi:TRAP transporter small permease [Virgibacillus xinjiangensis]|uniref:TRAP transporter small permease n=1 Tax=Virgibacillus xinjiangensis TaxID=393090 RepID=A0ABV7CZT6_9BACI
MDRILHVINRATEIITMSLLLAMVALVFLQVCTRLLLDSSFSWTDELARYMFIWVVFLGGGIAFQHGTHISIEAMKEKLPFHLQRVLQVFVTVVCILFFILLITTGIQLMNSSMSQTSPALSLPMGLMYSVIPVSGLLQIWNVIDINRRNWSQPNGSVERLET